MSGVNPTRWRNGDALVRKAAGGMENNLVTQNIYRHVHSLDKCFAVVPEVESIREWRLVLRITTLISNKLPLNRKKAKERKCKPCNHGKSMI